MFKIELNLKEIAIGAAFGIAFFLKLGAFALSAMGLCMVLWALGGAKNKAFRRFGVPAAFLVCAYMAQPHTPILSAVITFAALVGVLCIGYGIPDRNDPTGSFLGRLAYKLALRYAHVKPTGGDADEFARRVEMIASIVLRCGLSLAAGLACLPVVGFNLAFIVGLAVLVAGTYAAVRYVEGTIGI